MKSCLGKFNTVYGWQNYQSFLGTQKYTPLRSFAISWDIITGSLQGTDSRIDMFTAKSPCTTLQLSLFLPQQYREPHVKMAGSQEGGAALSWGYSVNTQHGTPVPNCFRHVHKQKLNFCCVKLLRLGAYLLLQYNIAWAD